MREKLDTVRTNGISKGNKDMKKNRGSEGESEKKEKKSPRFKNLRELTKRRNSDAQQTKPQNDKHGSKDLASSKGLNAISPRALLRRKKEKEKDSSEPNISVHKPTAIPDSNGSRPVQHRPSKSRLPKFSPVEQVRAHLLPLIEKLQSLSDIHAHFPSELAKTMVMVEKHKEVSNKSVIILRETLPDLLDPLDLFDSEQQKLVCNDSSGNTEHLAFKSLNNLIIRLSKLTDALGESYPDLAAQIEVITGFYTDFRGKLRNGSKDEKKALFSPTPHVVGEHVDFSVLPYDLALKLLCRDRYNKKVKTVSTGMHPVAPHNGVYYKPNVKAHEQLSMDLFIRPGMEYAIFCLFQLFAGEHLVAAPTSWIKVSHVRKFVASGKSDGYMEQTIQAGLGIPDMSLQDLLIVVSKTQLFARSVSRTDGIRAIKAILEREEKLSELSKKFPIAEHISKAKILKDKKGVSNDQFLSLELTQEIIRTVTAIIDELPEEIKKQLVEKQPRGLGSFVNGGVELSANKEEYDWIVQQLKTHEVSEIFTILALLPECYELILQVHSDVVIDFLPYVKYFKILLPNATPSEMFDALPSFLSRLDIEHFSATFLGFLFAKPTDAKPDNFQVRFIRDPVTLAVISFQIIGIDNDRALTYPIISAQLNGVNVENYHMSGIKCVLFLFEEALQKPIAWKVKDFLLSQAPVFWILDWAILLYEHTKKFQARSEERAILKSDLIEEAIDGDRIVRYKSLDIPILLSENTFFQLYNEIESAQVFLTDKPNASHYALLEKLFPIICSYYKKMSQKNPDVFYTYGKIHDPNRPSLESEFPDIDLSEFTKHHESHIEESTFSVPEAIVRFFDGLEWDKLSKDEEFLVLRICAREFPELRLFSNRPTDWLNQRLVEAVYRGYSELVQMLLNAGANINFRDEAHRTPLHVLAQRIVRIEEDDFFKTLDVLLSCSDVELSAYDSSGLTPLQLLVVNTHKDTARKSVKAIKIFIANGEDIEFCDRDNGYSLLDFSVERDLPDIFISLVELRAGVRVNVDKAYAFVRKYVQIEAYRALMEVTLHLLIKINAEFSYRVALSNMCSSKPILNSVMLEGAESGTCFLKNEISSQIFGPALDINEDSPIEKAEFYLKVSEKNNGESVSVEASMWDERSASALIASSLRLTLFGHGGPYSEAFKFTSKSSNSKLLRLSSAVDGFNFETILQSNDLSVETLAGLSGKSISEQILYSLLVKPTNDIARYFVLEVITVDTKLMYRLVRTNANQDYATDTSRLPAADDEPDVISVIFCLDNMSSPLDSDVVKYFVSVNPEQVLRKCLSYLNLQEERLKAMFSLKEPRKLISLNSSSFKTGKSTHTKISSDNDLSIELPLNFVADLYERMTFIQQLLKSNGSMSGIQLLRAVYPALSFRYDQVLNLKISPLARLEKVIESAPPQTIHFTSESGGMFAAFRSSSYSRGIWVDTAENDSDFISLKNALKILDLIAMQAKELDAVVSDLQLGNFAAFLKLHLSIHKEAALNRIDWNSLNENLPLQTAILHFIIDQRHSFYHLNFANFRSLTEASLRLVLQNSPDLRKLDLRYCPQITDSILIFVEKHCPKLEYLNLSGTKITEVRDLLLPRLRTLITIDCSHLVIITTTENIPTTPDLRYLKSYNSPKLIDVSPNAPSLKKVDVHNCSRLNRLILSDSDEVNDTLLEVIAYGCNFLTSACDSVKRVLIEQVIQTQDNKDKNAQFLSSHSVTLLNRLGVSLKPCSLRTFNVENLRGISIPGADLSNADLEGLDLSGSNLQDVRVWDTNLRDTNLAGANLSGLSVGRSHVYDEGIGPLTSITFSSNGLRAMAYSFNGRADARDTLVFFDLITGAYQKFPFPDGQKTSCVAITDDWLKIFVGTKDSQLYVLDHTLKPDNLMMQQHDSITCVDVSSDGLTGISGSKDNSIAMWDLNRGSLITTYVHDADGYNIVRLPTIMGSSHAKPEKKTARINSVSITPNGQKWISGSSDHTVLYSSKYEKNAFIMYGHSDSVQSVALSADGSHALSGSKDTTVILWRLSIDKSGMVLTGHTAGVNCVAIEADGSLGISGSNDQTIRVWDLETGTCTRVISSLHHGVLSLDFQPEGSKCIASFGDGSVRIWDLDVNEFHNAHPQSINFQCQGLNLKGCTGLNSDTLDFFVNNGATCGEVGSESIKKHDEVEAATVSISDGVAQHLKFFSSVSLPEKSETVLETEESLTIKSEDTDHLGSCVNNLVPARRSRTRTIKPTQAKEINAEASSSNSSGSPNNSSFNLLDVDKTSIFLGGKLSYIDIMLSLSSNIQVSNIGRRQLALVATRARSLLDSMLRNDPGYEWKLAAICGLEEIVERVLGEDIATFQDSHGHTPAEFYALGGQLKCLVRFLNLSSVREKLRCPKTAIDILSKLAKLATLGGHKCILEYLRDRWNFALDFIYSSSDQKSHPRTLFVEAAMSGDIDTFLFLRNNKVPIPKVVLMRVASTNGNWPLFDLLRGENPNYIDRKVAPVIAKDALRSGNINLALSLISEFNISTKCLAIDVITSGDSQLFRLALQNKWLTIRDRFASGATVQHLLAKCGHLDLLLEILGDEDAVCEYDSVSAKKYGACFVLDENRRSLLHYAAVGDQWFIYSLLVQNFNLSNLPFDCFGNTIAHAAARSGAYSFLKKLSLTEYGPTMIKAENYRKETLLHSSLGCREVSFIFFLIDELGIDPVAADIDGNTFLHKLVNKVLSCDKLEVKIYCNIITSVLARYTDTNLLDVENYENRSPRHMLVENLEYLNLYGGFDFLSSSTLFSLNTGLE